MPQPTPPPQLLPGERKYQANGRGVAVVTASRDRASPGTPSRKDKLRESSAVQDPGLKDYVRGYSFSCFRRNISSGSRGDDRTYQHIGLC